MGHKCNRISVLIKRDTKEFLPPHKYTHKEIQWTHIGKAAICKARETSHQKLNQPAPWSWTFSTPKLPEMNFCCLSNPVCDILLWQPELTNTNLQQNKKKNNNRKEIDYAEKKNFKKLSLEKWKHMHTKTCPWIFIVASFIIAPKSTQPKCPSERTNKIGMSTSRNIIP